MTDPTQTYRRYLAGISACAHLHPVQLKYAAASTWTRMASPRRMERTLVGEQMQSCQSALSRSVEQAWSDYLWHVSANALNTYLYSSMSPDWLGKAIKVLGEEHLRTAYERHAGVLVLSGHQHSLMLLNVTLGLLKFRTHAILLNPELTVPDFLKDYSERVVRDTSAHFNGGGYLVVDYNEAFVRPIYRTLQAGHVIMSANDFPTSLAPKRRQILPFLGRHISCPTGSVEIALQCGAAIVPSFVRREKGHLLVEFHPELTGNIESIMCTYGKLLAATVQADPGCWEGWKWPDVFDVPKGI